MSLKIIWNDILNERADAIVTPASRNPRIGIGLDRVIHQTAGPGLLAERKKLGRIGPGRVGVSAAFALRRTTGAKWVIHALGPVWEKNGGGIKDELILDGCYLRILCKAVELGCKTVSIPVLSSGKFGMPMGMAVDVAVKAITDFIAAFPKLEVKLVGIDSDFHEYAAKHYPNLTTARYSAEAERKYRMVTGQREDDPTSLDDAFMMGEEGDYYDEQLIRRLSGDGTFKGMFHRLWEYTVRREKAAKDEKRRRKEAIGDGEFIVSQKALSDATLIPKATIKHLCSNGKEALRTSRDNVIALCIAMKLPLEYATRLMASCGYSLDFNRRDKIIRRHIEERKGGLASLSVDLQEAGEADLAVSG